MRSTNPHNLRGVALGINTQVQVVWVWDGEIENCLGFSIRQLNLKTGVKKPLSSRLVKFRGEDAIGNDKTTTDDLPIQGCKWIHGGVKVGGEYQYEIVPMIGEPGKLKEGPGILTNTVKIGFNYGPFMAAFNRGHLVSSQKVSELLEKGEDGVPKEGALLEAINDDNSPLGRWLEGSDEEGLGGLYDFTKMSYNEARRLKGHIRSLYYELSDPRFVQMVIDNMGIWEGVLGNTGANDAVNAPTRALFRKEGLDVTDRMLPNGHIPHNKVDEVDDDKGKPYSAMFRSVNPTRTGYRTQANHALYVINCKVAAVVKDYIGRIKKDCEADPLQSDELRASNINVSDPVDLGGGISVQVICSPCTTFREKPKTPADGKTFPLMDMAPTTKATKDLVLAVQQSLYGVAFYPGFPSIVDAISYLAHKKPNIPIRFTVSTEQALPKPPRKRRGGRKSLIDTTTGMPAATPQDLVSGVPEGMFVAKESGLIVPKEPGLIVGGAEGLLKDGKLISPKEVQKHQVMVFQPGKKFPVIIAAEALTDGFDEVWLKELLKLSTAHAITHAKFAALDAFGDEPILIGAASDNMGLAAATRNDEIYLIIRGCPVLVQAYAVFAMGVHSHFLWRYLVKTGQSTFTGELETDASWQEKYYAKDGKTRSEYEAIIAKSVLK